MSDELHNFRNSAQSEQSGVIPRSPVPADRFVIWPTMVVIGALAILTMMSISSLMMAIAAFVAVVPLLCAGLALLRFFQSVLKRRWRGAASLAVVPLFLMALAYAPLKIVYATNYVGNLIAFATVVHQFDEELSKLPDDGKRYHQFDWGSFGGLNVSLTYDETDTLPTTLRECRSVDHFIGHYYYCLW
ncbi:hypothetical protein QA648_24525 (plasmid) [Rhizobium sp. CB3171]|uniref:hypothetical protein n=1 Tax=Rhizobium sp. CB3171 TaxID=3039157 RepID=UPI0024B05F3D|nr:hypothetical protein [Rhizobium sp. CB3171]WFU06282.1 hypothetical protein QA648_24525 [Rhizobium sp. CB3171]